ncbi:CST complex subunit CTC1 [Haplochromis burtoni]|uniref:CST complex subunit CTC1 n=1 Tax=Haplochromis burtoni TaxID=8153 RepID=UPI0006C97622|nr:CST complex subunit CTC1 [Haplochromis burtoni]
MNGKRREHGGDGQREDINRRRTGSCLKAVSGSLSAGGETGTRSEDMDPLQELLDRVKPSTEAESLWLKNIFTSISEHLSPVVCSSAPSQTGNHGDLSLFDLSMCAVQAIQHQMCVAHSLPVSYRLLSVSQLVSQQHLACVSNLSWSTNQQRAWAREAELAVPGQRALPRVNLLLIGCLREGPDGEYRLTDASGSVMCVCLSLSPPWLDRPVFLPHWNYIPHNASGQEEAAGFLELIGSPVLLCPGAEQRLAAAPGRVELSGAVGVGEAGRLLRHRVKGQRLSVFGEVGSVCPLLAVAGTTFFCFTLTDESRSLPVLVQDSSRLSWIQRVCVGQSVCVTALRVCALRGWRGNNILCVTKRSELHADYTHTQEHTQEHTHSESLLSQPAEDDCEEAEHEEVELDQSAVRIKHSKVISYQGTVTEVVSEGAGLYVLDGKVGLCVAYQPAAKRKLRAGDRVELHHAHFLYRPCPDFPPSMLCTCLRSSLRVTAFSRAGGSPPDNRCPGDGALPRLLLQRNTDVSDYLWTCHLSSQLAHSLVQGVWRQQCVCLLSWRLMETLSRAGGRGRRDIYAEMLDEPHTCPVTQYSVSSAVRQYLGVSELLESLQTGCWSSAPLSSLLPPDGSNLTSSQINGFLSWSCRTLSSEPQGGDAVRQRPLLLVGLLELPSQTSEFKHSMQLRDAAGAAACVLTESSEEEGAQRAVFNSAWIGCLVGVVQFTMVTERFLQSDFPSYQHLDQDRFITHKHCRVYLQFSLDHLHILSPSVAMETHLRHKGEEPGGDVTARKQTVEEEEETAGSKRRRREEEEADFGNPWPCVSMVIRVEQKEGVSWRNTGAEAEDQEAGLRLCFSVKAAVIGPVVSWRRDPKNEPMTEKESEQKQERKVVLVFSGVCTRWFPVLQPGCFYRLIAANTQDPSVLIGCGVSERSGVDLHAESTLQVRRGWRFHTLTRPLLLPTCRQAVPPTVLSVSEVLDCSSELVCFQGVVSERISVNNRTAHSGHTHSGVRLTLCDQAGRSLQVYLDLSHTPYPPGLLPGNTLLLSGFQRRLSRTGSVYCTYLPVSSITVVSLGDTSSAQPPPPAPIMHLGEWALSSKQRCAVGQVKGHVVCFLFLQLQWSCSLCGSVYTQGCSSSQCHSTSSVFQSKAKLVIDDGTGEAHVWFSAALVRALLGLADAQWEGLQRALRVRGHIRVFPRGQSQVCDGDADDFLLHFLLCLCSSDVMIRPLSLTCRKHTNQRPEEVRRFTRGDREFLTRLAPPLQLTCLHLHPD